MITGEAEGQTSATMPSTAMATVGATTGLTRRSQALCDSCSRSLPAGRATPGSIYDARRAAKRRTVDRRLDFSVRISKVHRPPI